MEVNPIEAERAQSWMSLIMEYLQNGTLLEDKNEARRVQYRSSWYLIQNGVLYKRGHVLPLLRCATEGEANYVMCEVHEGICGNHSGGRSLAKKILRAAYYWPTMERDAQEFVKKCDKCQRFSNVPRLPARELISI